MSIITIPQDVKIYNEPGSVWWFNEDGILYSISKKHQVAQSKEEIEKQFERLNQFLEGKKVCMLIDITYAKPTTKEEREVGAALLNKVVKAMAMVSDKTFSRMVANVFFELKPPPYPTKFFSNETEAKEWLKKYL